MNRTVVETKACVDLTRLYPYTKRHLGRHPARQPPTRKRIQMFYNRIFIFYHKLQIPQKYVCIYIYIYDPGSRFATTLPPHMVWPQNLRFAAFRMKTLYLQCFLHGGLLARSANLQIRWIFATNLPKTCYLQCFGFDIVE